VCAGVSLRRLQADKMSPRCRWMELKQAGNDSFKAGQYGDASQRYSQAIKELEKSSGWRVFCWCCSRWSSLVVVVVVLVFFWKWTSHHFLSSTSCRRQQEPRGPEHPLLQPGRQLPQERELQRLCEGLQHVRTNCLSACLSLPVCWTSPPVYLSVEPAATVVLSVSLSVCLCLCVGLAHLSLCLLFLCWTSPPVSVSPVSFPPWLL